MKNDKYLSDINVQPRLFKSLANIQSIMYRGSKNFSRFSTVFKRRNKIPNFGKHTSFKWEAGAEVTENAIGLKLAYSFLYTMKLS